MWSRSKSTVLVPACLLLFSLAAAEEGAFVSREQARAAIEQAERDKADSEARYTQARRDCEGTFLVNSCLEQARSEHRRRTQEIRAREVAARDATRRFDAGERARARAERSAREETPKAPRRGPGESDASTRQPPARRTTAAETLRVPAADAARAAQDKAADAEKRRAKIEQRAAAEAEDRARRDAEQAERAAQSAAQAERYEQRQRDAKAREEEKLRSAKENEQRREKRRLERAAEEARRQPAQQ